MTHDGRFLFLQTTYSLRLMAETRLQSNRIGNERIPGNAENLLDGNWGKVFSLIRLGESGCRMQTINNLKVRIGFFSTFKIEQTCRFFRASNPASCTNHSLKFKISN